MQHIRIFGFTFLMLSLLACKTGAKLERPEEKYEDLAERSLSIVNIPVIVDLRQLEQILNRQLQVLYEDNDLNDGDQMMLRAVKNGEIHLQVDSQKVIYTVPLLLWIKYDAGLAHIEANGEILLNMATGFEIQPDWNIATRTELIDYEWLREPKLRMGAVSIPVGSLLNVVIRNGRHYLTREMDKQVKENLKLKEVLGEVWQQMFHPILLSEEFNTWLTINPQRLAMTPLTTMEDKLSATIVVESYPDIKLGEAPVRQLLPPPLPPLQFVQQTKEDFVLNIFTEIDYEEAERIARVQMVGETYRSGKYAVTDKDVELYGSGNKLVVKTLITGSYNGNIYLEGEPVYNSRRNQVEIEDLDFTLSTKNVLHRSAGWILRGAIRRNIEQNMRFLLDYNLSDMRDQLQSQLRHQELLEGLVLDGQLQELNIRNVYLTPQAIMVNIGLSGRVNLKVSLSE